METVIQVTMVNPEYPQLSGKIIATRSSGSTGNVASGNRLSSVEGYQNKKPAATEDDIPESLSNSITKAGTQNETVADDEEQKRSEKKKARRREVDNADIGTILKNKVRSKQHTSITKTKDRYVVVYSSDSEPEESLIEADLDEDITTKKRKRSYTKRSVVETPPSHSETRRSAIQSNTTNTRSLITREELRNSRKSLVGQSNTDDEEEEKCKKVDDQIKAQVPKIETARDIVKAFPESKVIKERIQTVIRRDAAKELLKARATKDGKAHNGDVERIVRIYNAFGYKFVTRKSLAYSTSLLVNTQTYKTLLSRYGIKTIEIDKDEINPNITEPVTKPGTDTNNMSEIQHDHPTGTAGSDSAGANLTDEAVPVTEDMADVNLPQKRKIGGRPRGSRSTPKDPSKMATNTSKSKQWEVVTSKACELFAIELERAKANGEKRVAKGTLPGIIEALEREHGMVAGSVTQKTVRSRLTAGNVTGKHSERTPILESIEPEVIDYCVALANMGQPLLKEQVLLVTNQLIKVHNLEGVVVDYKKKRKIIVEGDDDFDQKALIGTAWFQGFRTRHMDDIVAKCGRDLMYVNRHFQLRVDHYKAMYDRVYESMVKSGIAEKYAKPSLFDIEGGRVSHTEREWAYGLPSQYKLTKPEYVLYVDEIGSKVKADRQLNFYGHVDGQMLNLPVDCSGGMDLGSDTTEMKFSVYCFSNGLGEAVLCAIVFMSDKDISDIPLSVRWGIDTLKPLNGGRTELELFENNCGVGQAMQGGPVCFSRGKEVNSYVGTSVDGKMNCQILHDICKHIDEIGLYDRSNGLSPFMLMDGHCTNIDMEFIDYVNDGRHQWTICCGLPRDTHLLHVAFSDELNGAFKDEFHSLKQRLLDSRAEHRMQFYPTDIIPLVHNAWSVSYSQPESTKRAIALRGWNPLNYALLLHPMLNKRGQQLSEVTKKKPPLKTAAL